jgi:ATP-dependent RNA helicase DHX57
LQYILIQINTPDGFQCRIKVSKRNKKTSQLDVVQFCPKDHFFETAQLAKHSSATYALHRISSHLKIKTLLPPTQRDLWEVFEDAKFAVDEEVRPFLYSSDPFIGKDNLQSFRETQRVSKPTIHNSPWLKYPILNVPKQLREMIEEVLNANIVFKPKAAENLNAKPLQKSLLKQGFLPSHVTECLLYTSTLDKALEWLYLHIPESDLPKSLQPVDFNQVIVQNYNSNDLAEQYIIRKLISTGFSSENSANAVRQWINEIDTVTRLCWSLIDRKFEDSPNFNQIDFDEELEVLESIYGPDISFERKEHGTIISINVQFLAGKSPSKLNIYVSISQGYPFTVPGMIIADDEIPSYIRLGVMQKALQNVLDLIGQPMIFQIISWMEENAQKMMLNPPPLVSLRQRSENELSKIMQPTKGKELKAQRALKNANFGLLNQLKDKYRTKLESPEYIDFLRKRQKLPAFQAKQEICDLLDKNSVLLICGETGCGKSTQTPQFILDNALTQVGDNQCKIICTQPRRISATSLAERVSDELCEPLGGLIGYSIRGESVQTPDTKVLFCTTGVLLRMAQEDPLLKEVSHIVIDEVHERGIESDFLLILLKDLLKKRVDLKVILMSATVDADLFSNYFQCPVVNIPGFTYPVQDIYLEEILSSIDYVPKNRKLKKKDDLLIHEDEHDSLLLKKLNSIENAADYSIDYEMIVEIVKKICSESKEGAVLIFLSGIAEIKRCCDMLRSSLSSFTSVFPLHSSLTNVEQKQVFSKMAKGRRKIIVSTNIAETSVTM